MTKNSNSKQYDLEDRTLAFAKNVLRTLKPIFSIMANKR
jgi:hypothetical protein